VARSTSQGQQREGWDLKHPCIQPHSPRGKSSGKQRSTSLDFSQRVSGHAAALAACWGSGQYRATSKLPPKQGENMCPPDKRRWQSRVKRSCKLLRSRTHRVCVLHVALSRPYPLRWEYGLKSCNAASGIDQEADGGVLRLAGTTKMASTINSERISASHPRLRISTKLTGCCPASPPHPLKPSASVENGHTYAL